MVVSKHRNARERVRPSLGPRAAKHRGSEALDWARHRWWRASLIWLGALLPEGQFLLAVVDLGYTVVVYFGVLGKDLEHPRQADA